MRLNRNSLRRMILKEMAHMNVDLGKAELGTAASMHYPGHDEGFSSIDYGAYEDDSESYGGGEYLGEFRTQQGSYKIFKHGGQYIVDGIGYSSLEAALEQIHRDENARY